MQLLAAVLLCGSPVRASISQLLSGSGWKLSNANNSIHIPAQGIVRVTSYEKRKAKKAEHPCAGSLSVQFYSTLESTS